MKSNVSPFASRLTLALAALAFALPADAAAADIDKTLKSLTLYASFDKGVDADFAKGDPTLFTRTATKPT